MRSLPRVAGEIFGGPINNDAEHGDFLSRLDERRRIIPADGENRAAVAGQFDFRLVQPSGVVGFDPGSYSRLPSSPVVFRLEGDGRVLWISPPLGPTTVLTFRAKVSKVQVLTLVTACGGSNYYARAAWGTPTLTKKVTRNAK